MKKKNIHTIILILYMFLFVGTVIVAFGIKFIPDKTEKRDATTENVVYSEAYEANLREEVITELYGSREQYAKDQTGDRADYVDRAASMGGELVIDEARMQAVYDSKLKEFDSKVDQEKVDQIVKERQEQLISEEVFKDYNKKDTGWSKDMMYWNNGGKYFAVVELFVLILYVLYVKRKK